MMAVPTDTLQTHYKPFNSVSVYNNIQEYQFTHLPLHCLVALHSALRFSTQQTGGEGTNQPPVLVGAHTGTKQQSSVSAERA